MGFGYGLGRDGWEWVKIRTPEGVLKFGGIGMGQGLPTHMYATMLPCHTIHLSSLILLVKFFFAR